MGKKKVSAKRLKQKSGSKHSFGGYKKVKKGDGKFRMVKD